MQSRSLVISVTLVAAFVLALALIAQAADPILGTWKMNPAKSKFSYPTPKSYTITFSVQDDGVKAVEDEIDADGKAIHRSWTAKYDGKERAGFGKLDKGISGNLA